MFESKNDTAPQHHPSKPFIDIRFVLLGFDSVKEANVRAKLVNGGGIDIGKYSQNCTHVIVDNLVYDDPQCVAARNDAKILVTGLWVNHSVDVGIPVDSSSIMYRPLNDLNGVPGAKALIICLTGYQRQDRDDIMTMVGLMGANFSKPLVANKVTHLICYKFEGEKYELAKKMKKIKLVNHQWLEDCLKAWELLPEANYNRSGYELETMEAEAKDSEDERERAPLNLCRARNVTTSPNLQTEMIKAQELLISAGPGTNFQLKTTAPNGPSINTIANDLSLTNAKVTPGFEDPAVRKDASNDLSDLKSRIPTSTKVESVNISPLSNTINLSSKSYERKTLRRSTPSVSKEMSGNGISTPKSQLIDSSPSKIEKAKDRDDSSFVKTRSQATELSFEEGPTGALLPQKRNKDILTDSSKSQKTSHDSRVCNLESSSMNGRSKHMELASLADGPNDSSCVSRSINGGTLHETGSLSSDKTLTRQTVDDEKRDQQNQQQNDILTSDGKILTTEKSNTPIHSKSKSGNDNSLTRSGRKKSAKKSLGSRPKLNTFINKKGSIYFNRTAFRVATAVSSIGRKETDELEKSPTVNAENALETGNEAEKNAVYMDDETEAPDDTVGYEFENANSETKSEVVEKAHKADTLLEDKSGIHNLAIKGKGGSTREDGVCGEKTDLGELKETNKRKQFPLGKINKKTVIGVITESKQVGNHQEAEATTKDEKNEKKSVTKSASKKKSGTIHTNKPDSSVELEKENKPNGRKCQIGKSAARSHKTLTDIVKVDPQWFILTGHKLQRKEFQQVIRRLKGKLCRDSHQWSYQATHLIVPDPIRRTEKFFAAAASGRWILKSDYLTASNQAGSFLAEEPYEWHKKGLTEDGAINLEAPRKWRILRERTDHGAFYGMRIIVYGECIAPPLDTLKRVIKAGDGTILATSPPYTRFLNSGVDFAIVSPSMPHVDSWIQEFIRYEIPCVVADYLVEYVCKPGYSLERHVLYNTHAWAEKSFAKLQRLSEEVNEGVMPLEDCSDNDLTCQVCGSSDRGEVMLICGDESGSVGCGIGTHIDCCDPPLKDVPSEDWFCPKCVIVISTSSNFTRSVKRKKPLSQSK